MSQISVFQDEVAKMEPITPTTKHLHILQVMADMTETLGTLAGATVQMADRPDEVDDFCYWRN